MALIPCSACQRHVYITETTCPFCQHQLGPVDTTLLRRPPTGRMSRAALMVLGMSSVACGGDTDQSGDDSATNSESTQGGPSTTSTSGSTNSTNMSVTVTSNTSSAQAVYGAPPMGGFGVSTTSAGGSGGTSGEATGSGGSGGEEMGGAAGEAGDTGGNPGGAGGTTPLPSSGVGGSGGPIYGAPPTPW